MILNYLIKSKILVLVRNMQNKKIEKIKFKYLFDKLYNPVYCTGAFGGVTPKNEVVLNFFMERQPIPYSETRQINKDGSLGNIIEVEPENDLHTVDIVRYVETGVIMDLETAKEIHAWLGENIEALMKGN